MNSAHAEEPMLSRPTRHRTRLGSGGSPRLIVHVIDGLPVGGAETHLVTIIREALATYPIRHRVVSLFGDGPVADQVRALNIPLDIMDLRPLLGQRRYLAAAHELSAHFARYRPDVVEAHLTWSRLLGLYGASRARVPTRIGFEHGDIYLTSGRFRLANYVGQHFANRIIVCSEALAKWNQHMYHTSRRRLQVMHNCVDPDRFRPGLPNDRHNPPFDPPQGATRFCAVGTLGDGVNKRTDICIRAIHAAREQHADVGLVICGDGPQRATLEALTNDLGVAPHVRFLGTRTDVPEVMAACDAFCHAAPWEPFGIVVIEAMAAALPVIVPNGGGIPEAVDNGITGLIYPPLDHEALAAAMIRLHQQPELRHAMGRAGRHAAESRFSVRSYVRRLYDLYGIARPDDCVAAA